MKLSLPEVAFQRGRHPSGTIDVAEPLAMLRIWEMVVFTPRQHRLGRLIADCTCGDTESDLLQKLGIQQRVRFADQIGS